MEHHTRYQRFFTSILTQDVDIDFIIGWQKQLFWIVIPDIDVFLRQYRNKRQYRKKRRYQRFCDDDIERKCRYRDNNVDIGYDIIYII